MDSNKNINFLKSSNLMFATAGLASVNFLLLPNSDKVLLNVFFVIFALIIFVGLGFLIRSGKNSIKYFLITLILAELLTGFPGMFLIMKVTQISMIINLLQLILQVYAVILLFKIPKKLKNETIY